MAITKSYNLTTPNLGLSDNDKVQALWGAAGRLTGLTVTAATFSGSVVSVTLSPGKFLHTGVVVSDDSTTTWNITFTGAFPTTEPVYLVAQANGADESVAPTYSLIPRSQFLAQADPANYGAVIAQYTRRAAANAFNVQSPVLSTSGTWTYSGTSKIVILGGGGGPSDAVIGANGQIDEWLLTPIADVQANSVRSMTINFLASADSATATTATGTVTVSTAVSGARYSIFINGFESAYVATATDTPTTIAVGLQAAVLANADVSYLINPTATTNAAGVITLVSQVQGRQAMFDLVAVATLGATVSSVPMAGGTQSYFQVEFPVVAGGPTTLLPVTVYPPISASNVFGSVSVPVDLNGMSAATFSTLRLRPKVFAVGAGAVRVGFTQILVTYTETNSAIDVSPPSNLAHWAAGASVAVAGSSSTSSLAAHRLAVPIDHPLRSVNREYINYGAVGPNELSSRVVGTGFTEGVHTATQLLQPWTITNSDLNLKEQSDLVKGLSQTVNGTTGTAYQFQRDHNPTTGHHRGATYADLTGGTGNQGVIVEATASGDAAMDPSGDTTKAQAFLATASTLTTPALYSRSAVLGSAGARSVIGITSQNAAEVGGLILGTGTITTATNSTAVTGVGTIFTSELAGAGTRIYNSAGTYIGTIQSVTTDTAAVLTGNAILAVTAGTFFWTNTSRREIMAEFSADGTQRIARFSRTREGAQAFYGVKSVSGLSVQSLQSARVSLFSGGLTFMQCGTPWNRLSGTYVYSDQSVSTATADTAGLSSAQATSYNPNTLGCVMYHRRQGVPSENNSSGGFSGNAPSNQIYAYNGFHFPYESITAGFLATSSTPNGSAWVYLPFPIKDVFDRVIVRVNMSCSPDFSTVAQAYLYRYMGLMAYPAYDSLALGQISLTAPSSAALTVGSGTYQFPATATGIVRRQPWVLTPTGYAKAIGTGINGAYYDPRKGVNAYFSATPVSRTTNLNAAGTVPAGSMLDANPLPYYDIPASGYSPTGTQAMGGVVMDNAQGYRLPHYFNATAPASLSYYGNEIVTEVAIPMKDFTNSLITLSGTGRTPDGVAICVSSFDQGLWPTQNSLSNYTGRNYIYYLNLEIEGVAGGRYTPVTP